MTDDPNGMTSRLKMFLKHIPGVSYLYHQYVALTLKRRSPDQVFTDFFAGNKWRGTDSVSGRGSDLQQTRVVARELPVILRDLGVRSVLDIPCGDYHWMQHVGLDGVTYIGADIVAGLIDENARRYNREGVSFRKLDLMKDQLPAVDLIFCRDCLVHLAEQDIFSALRNVCDSGSTFLLTTTFPERSRNPNIATGQWRPLNLQAQPFGFPAPLLLLNEECTQDRGRFKDKSLGLWRVSDIRAHLSSRGALQ